MDSLHSLDSAGGFGPPGRGIEALRALLSMILITINYIRLDCNSKDMSPGIGLMKRRLEKEKDAISLAISGIMKKYKIPEEEITTLETKYDDNAGDWYVALGWKEKKVIIKMDSVQGTITEIKEI